MHVFGKQKISKTNVKQTWTEKYLTDNDYNLSTQKVLVQRKVLYRQSGHFEGQYF